MNAYPPYHLLLLSSGEVFPSVDDAYLRLIAFLMD
jgi:hypothetical protein